MANYIIGMLKTDTIVDDRSGSSDAYGKTGLGRARPELTGTQHTALSHPSDLANKANSRVYSNYG